MTPWSVSPRAGCSNAAARSASASILQAPSSTEYSECTWRWTQVTASRIYGRGPTARSAFFARTGLRVHGPQPGRLRHAIDRDRLGGGAPVDVVALASGEHA